MTSLGRTLAMGLFAALLLGAAAGAASFQSSSNDSSIPNVLQPGHCYRLVFYFEPSPNYKVLELLRGGWIRAEVDAGPSTSAREPVWINVSQIIAVRTARCSD